MRPGVASQGYGTAHISLDQSKSLVYVRFCFLLVLLYQDGADKFIDFIFRSQLSKFLTKSGFFFQLLTYKRRRAPLTFLTISFS